MIYSRLHRLLSVISLGVVLAGCGGGAVPAPTAYKEYAAKESSFTVQYPDGWDVKGGGKGNHCAKFSKSSALISVSTNLSDSLMGDLASIGAGSNSAHMTEEDAAVHKIHLKNKGELAEDFGETKEEKPVKFVSMLGEGRKSEFTAGGGLGGSIHGYRATILGRDRRLKIVCTCSESDWPTLKPAFDKVLESFGHGTG